MVTRDKNGVLRRKQLGIFVSVPTWENIKRIAFVQNTSINHITNVLLEDYIQKNQKALKDYQKIQKVMDEVGTSIV